MSRPPDARQVLLVEDDPGDAQLVRIAWSECRLDVALDLVRDGTEALAYLRREPPYEQAPRPDLILLDLNLPRMDGRELLGVLKNDPDLAAIPVCVLTTSRAQTDVRQTYALRANAYVSKPLSILDFVEMVRSIDRFWFRCALLPNR